MRSGPSHATRRSATGRAGATMGGSTTPPASAAPSCARVPRAVRPSSSRGWTRADPSWSSGCLTRCRVERGSCSPGGEPRRRPTSSTSTSSRARRESSWTGSPRGTSTADFSSSRAPKDRSSPCASRPGRARSGAARWSSSAGFASAPGGGPSSRSHDEARSSIRVRTPRTSSCASRAAGSRRWSIRRCAEASARSRSRRTGGGPPCR